MESLYLFNGGETGIHGHIEAHVVGVSVWKDGYYKWLCFKNRIMNLVHLIQILPTNNLVILPYQRLAPSSNDIHSVKQVCPFLNGLATEPIVQLPYGNGIKGETARNLECPKKVNLKLRTIVDWNLYRLLMHHFVEILFDLHISVLCLSKNGYP